MPPDGRRRPGRVRADGGAGRSGGPHQEQCLPCVRRTSARPFTCRFAAPTRILEQPASERAPGQVASPYVDIAENWPIAPAVGCPCTVEGHCSARASLETRATPRTCPPTLLHARSRRFPASRAVEAAQRTVSRPPWPSAAGSLIGPVRGSLSSGLGHCSARGCREMSGARHSTSPRIDGRASTRSPARSTAPPDHVGGLRADTTGRSGRSSTGCSGPPVKPSKKDTEG
jgi:hypothetical protein